MEAAQREGERQEREWAAQIEAAYQEAEEGREDYLNERAAELGQTRAPGEDAHFTVGF